MPPNADRLWFLDWVRVCAFGLLIPYHVGFFYSSWDWAANSFYAGPAIEPLLLFSSPWRLPLLFFVSGAACRFLRDRSSAGDFMRSRLLRLGVPLVFGVLIICAPIEYIEGRTHGALGPGFLQFLPRYWTHDPTLRYGLDWEHLWFVAYVLTYALLVAPLRDAIVRVAARIDPLLRHRWFVAIVPMLLIAVPFCILRGWFPVTNNLVRDWSNHVVFLPCFLFGFASVRSQHWRTVEDLRWPALIACVPLYAILIWSNTQYDMDATLRITMRFVRCAYLWAALLVVLGFARRWLNRPSATIAWLNRGVFCFYIIHQPVIVVVGYALTQQRVGVVGEAAVVLLTTIAACLATYVAADRLGAAKILFGLPRGSMRRQRLAQQQLAEQS
ncbi:acyltransferase family protein [Roseiterribacter gracilis]|uniref:Acetyltransferase n=1 Tax=Roseiterribacter gracilis TaxID=2812848 RepID=A0A8S8XCZ2_9PROT|nr:acetyltransferase [Rhodospirillales bacterium TMPK1]